MRGKRKNSEREAWRHPEDVVKLVDEFYQDKDRIRPDYISLLKTIAWLHDILEDGLKEVRHANVDGVDSVRVSDLEEAGFEENVIMNVKLLTRERGETKRQYLFMLGQSDREKAKIVKVLDRVANLREGKETMSDQWLKEYRRETLLYIVPWTTDRGRCYRILVDECQ